MSFPRLPGRNPFSNPFVRPFAFPDPARLSEETYFYDEFNEASTTNLTSHTPDTRTGLAASAMWVVSPGAVNVTGGLGMALATSVPAIAVVNVGLADGVLETAFYTGGGANNGIVFRHNGAGQFWMARVASGNLELYTFSPGATVRASTPCSEVQPFWMRVTLTGDDITVLVEDGTTLNHNNNFNATETRHGFRVLSAPGNILYYEFEE